MNTEQYEEVDAVLRDCINRMNQLQTDMIKMNRLLASARNSIAVLPAPMLQLMENTDGKSSNDAHDAGNVKNLKVNP